MILGIAVLIDTLTCCQIFLGISVSCVLCTGLRALNYHFSYDYSTQNTIIGCCAVFESASSHFTAIVRSMY